MPYPQPSKRFAFGLAKFFFRLGGFAGLFQPPASRLWLISQRAKNCGYESGPGTNAEATIKLKPEGLRLVDHAHVFAHGREGAVSFLVGALVTSAQHLQQVVGVIFQFGATSTNRSQVRI